VELLKGTNGPDAACNAETTSVDVIVARGLIKINSMPSVQSVKPLQS
jgi:hypothetical protein